MNHADSAARSRIRRGALVVRVSTLALGLVASVGLQIDGIGKPAAAPDMARFSLACDRDFPTVL